MNGADHLLLRLSTRLQPVGALGPEQRLRLLRSARVERLPSGTLLHAEQEANWLTYLIKGELLNRSPRGTLEHLAADSPRARMPIFQITCKGLHAITRGRCFVLRLDRRRFRKLLSERQADPALLSLPVQGEALATELRRRLKQRPLYLPPISSSARLLLALTVRPAPEADLADLLSQNAHLTYRFLAVANRGRNEPYAGVIPALAGLGPSLGHCIALGLALDPLFSSGSAPPFDALMGRLHAHSLLVGGIACLLARRCGQSPEQALLAGLVHDLGAVAALHQAGQDPHPRQDRAELELALRQLRGPLGPAAWHRLGLPGEIITAAEDAEHWYRDAGSQLELADVVALAHLFAALATPKRGPGPPLARVPALRKLGWPSEGMDEIRALVQRAGLLVEAVRHETGSVSPLTLHAV